MTPKEIARRLITLPGQSQVSWLTIWPMLLRELLRSSDFDWHYQSAEALDKLGLARVSEGPMGWTRRCEVLDEGLVRAVLEALEHPHN